MLLSELLQGLCTVPDALDVPIKNITTNSKNVVAQGLWLAPKGISHHALDYYCEELPPCAIVYEPPYDNPPPHAIACEDLSLHLSKIAGRFYGNPSQHLQMIGVTGTDGKSSLAYLLAASLKNCAMLGTIGYGPIDSLLPASHTTPEALLVQKYLERFRQHGMDTVVMEVSSHALAQSRVAAVKFDIAIFTNLSHEHLDYHHSMEEYFLVKASLFEKRLRWAIVNVDDSYGQRLIGDKLINPSARVITVSSKNAPIGPLHFSAEDIELTPQGLCFTLVFHEGSNVRRAAIHSKLLARFNVDNLLNVASCLYALGHNFGDIAARISNLQGVIGRAERINLSNGTAAIIDYAHTPNALQNVLQGVRPHVRGKLWCVFGCGGDRDPSKRPLMGRVASCYADQVVVTDDNPRREDPKKIIADISAALVKADNVAVVQPREQAIVFALEQLREGDAVVIAGKGHEDYQIIGDQRNYFSDRDVVEGYEHQRL